MKTWNLLPLQDWRLIQGAILGFAAATLLSGSSLFFAVSYRQYSARQLQAGQQQLDTLRNATAAALRNSLAAEQGKAQYIALQARGVLGQEHRPEWLEMLGNAHRQPGISGLRYRIEAQKPFGTQDPAGQVQIYATPMQLQYRVRHEESFSSIQKRISSAIGHAVMRRCQITRLPPAESTGLAVDCDYLWLNLASASGTAKEAQ